MRRGDDAAARRVVHEIVDGYIRQARGDRAPARGPVAQREDAEIGADVEIARPGLEHDGEHGKVRQVERDIRPRRAAIHRLVHFRRGESVEGDERRLRVARIDGKITDYCIREARGQGPRHAEIVGVLHLAVGRAGIHGERIGLRDANRVDDKARRPAERRADGGPAVAVVGGAIQLVGAEIENTRSCEIHHDGRNERSCVAHVDAAVPGHEA